MMVSLSHLQRLCHWIFGRVQEYSSSWMGSLWHFGRKRYEKVFAFSLVYVMGFPPRTLLVFSNCLLRTSNHAFLAVCGSQSDSSELLLVTPLAFSDLALARLGGTLLILGGSGVEVLLICILHWSLFAAKVLCWLCKLLVTALPCCSLTAWMTSCIVL